MNEMEELFEVFQAVRKKWKTEVQQYFLIHKLDSQTFELLLILNISDVSCFVMSL